MSAKISIVLCAYNAGKYIADAVQSVLQQTYQDWEFILIDDGSKDNTLELIRQLVGNDPRCRVISQANAGLIKSRNHGFSIATGEYIAIMDADDICMPTRLEKQCAILDAHPELCAVGSHVYLIDAHGRMIKPLLQPLTHDEIDNQHMLGRGGVVINPSTMIRRSALLQIGFYSEQAVHAEDFDLLLRLAEVGKLANIPEVLLHYRQHLGSIGYAHHAVQMQSAHNALLAAIQRRGLTGVRPPSSPSHEQISTADTYRKWSYWAANGGNYSTATHYLLQSIKAEPFALRENFKLALSYCKSLAGYLVRRAAHG